MSTHNDDALRCANSLILCVGEGLGDQAVFHLRRLLAENEALTEEMTEQCRIIGISSEREARANTLLLQAVEALTCTGEDDDPGHWCNHCDDYVDGNGTLRAAIKEHLKEQQ